MLTSRFAVAVCLFGPLVLGAGMAVAQTYPAKPIRILTSAPGGNSDVAARLIAQGLTETLRQQVIVDNRSGGGVVIGDIVAKARPDGYNLLLDGASFWITPLVQANPPYDPIKDFSPVTLATTSPNILVVHPSVPVNSVKELIALAKAKPGGLNYASGVAGSGTHLPGELFKSMTGVNIVNVPYKGGGPAVIALLGGQVQLMFASAGSVVQHIKSGKLKALAVTSAEPSSLAPGLPTVAASGLPGYYAVSLDGMFATAKTPVAIVNQLNQEIVRILHKAETKERFLNTGMEAVGNSPEQFAAVIKSEMTKWGKLIKDVGIRFE